MTCWLLFIMTSSVLYYYDWRVGIEPVAGRVHRPESRVRGACTGQTLNRRPFPVHIGLILVQFGLTLIHFGVTLVQFGVIH